MVWTRSLFGHSACGAGFEFAVFQDGKVDVAPIQIGEIDADPLADVTRVDGVWQMAGLCAFHLFNIDSRLGVTTVRRSAQRGDLSAFAPDVRLANIVIVRQTYRGAIFDDVAKIPAELEPGGIVAVVVVDLISRKEEYIRIDSIDVVDDDPGARCRRHGPGWMELPVKAATTISSLSIGFLRIVPS